MHLKESYSYERQKYDNLWLEVVPYAEPSYEQTYKG